MLLTADCPADLRYGLVHVDPSSHGVDPQVLGLLQRHGVSDGGVGAKVVVVRRHPQETGAHQRVLTQEVCVKQGVHKEWGNIESVFFYRKLSKDQLHDKVLA